MMKRKAITAIMGLLWAGVGIFQYMHDDIRSAALSGFLALVFIIAAVLRKETKE
ncbi:MAG: hypothetical protein K6B38_11550 [Ruminococcus sp.]|nr:hypothetical protein [Ruminococcus sp.]